MDTNYLLSLSKEELIDLLKKIKGLRKTKSIYDLDLNEHLHVRNKNYWTTYIRVPGGWTYSAGGGDTIFIPYNNEFEKKEKEKIEEIEKQIKEVEELGSCKLQEIVEDLLTKANREE